MLLDRQISAHTQTVAVSFIYCLQCFPSSVCVEQITGWMDGWMGDQSIEQCCCCCCCCCRIIDCLWSESAGEGVERSRAPVEHLRWATPSYAFATIGCKPADIASGNEERERERAVTRYHHQHQQMQKTNQLVRFVCTATHTRQSKLTNAPFECSPVKVDANTLV